MPAKWKVSLQAIASLGLAVLAATVQGADCPTDDAGWSRWAAAQARIAAQSPGESAILGPIAAQLDACRPQWGGLAKAACLAPLDRFTHAQLHGSRAGHSLGMAIDDATYYATLPYPELLELPELLRRPGFLQRLDAGDRASLDGAHAAIAKEHPDWRSFEYRSQHLYTPDGTQALGRFFVYIPGPDFDRYLQFGLRHDPAAAQPNGVSIVAVQKTDPKTHAALAAPRAYLIDRWRTRQKTGEIRLTTRLAVHGKVENCYECHKTAVLPITPDPAVFEAERFGKALREVNRAMARYRNVAFAGWDTYGYGPGLGPQENPRRTDAFLRSCSDGAVRPERLERLRDAMQCTACHDGAKRGALNYPSARRNQPLTSRSLVEMYVRSHRRMPPGGKDLTDDERGALFQCLRAEYYGTAGEPGLLERWLNGAECWSGR